MIKKLCRTTPIIGKSIRGTHQMKSKLAELIYQSSNQQFLYIENFLKLLKEQDEVLQSSPDLKVIEFEAMISTVENLVQQLLIKELN
jgi:hypothetical protein